LGRLILAVSACIALAAAAGCARDEGLAEGTYAAQHAGVRARVSIPIEEPRSIGTYRAEVEWPDGTREQIQAERDGMVSNVWLVDLDSNGDQELVVAMSSAGSGAYGSVHVYERRNSSFGRLGLAPLSDDQRVGYMGHDVFSIEAGCLLRSYPVYLEGDPNSTPTGGEAVFWYSLADTAWVTGTQHLQDDPGVDAATPN